MLEIKNISKKLGEFKIQNLTLKVTKGAYCVVLGKSGAGKSLLLELVAGIFIPDSGQIFLEGKNITNEKMQFRNIGMVFQDLALFPHYSVRENIAYALKTKKLSSKDLNDRISELASDLEISHLLDRKPDKLSGGEKQRVALARTLALDPKILLLDEPLVSLDIQLRSGLRKLLRKIHQKGQTIIHVTHDYEEAIALGTQIAVMHQGTFIQSGTPEHVFQHPKNEFIANFIGIKNFFKASISYDDIFQSQGTYKATINEAILIFIVADNPGNEGFIMIRGEDIMLSNEKPLSSAANNFEGVVTETYPGNKGIELVIDIGILITAIITRGSFQNLKISEGKTVWISFKATAVKFIGH